MTGTSNLITALFKPQRRFATFSAQVTIEEEHRDELEITEQPVELGAAISDHAYKRPPQLVIRCAWSNSTLESIGSSLTALLDLVGAESIVGAGVFNFAQDIYQQLLDLQESRIPFDIVTGKRTYRNMLLKGLATTTDEKTEHALFVSMFCQQVIIVPVTTVVLPAKAVQKLPQKTQSTANTGVKQPRAAVPSPGGAAPPAGNASSPAWGFGFGVGGVVGAVRGLL